MRVKNETLLTEKPLFRLAPFVVGIYESQLKKMDHEFAQLVEKYMADGGAAGIVGVEPDDEIVHPPRTLGMGA